MKKKLFIVIMMVVFMGTIACSKSDKSGNNNAVIDIIISPKNPFIGERVTIKATNQLKTYNWAIIDHQSGLPANGYGGLQSDTVTGVTDSAGQMDVTLIGSDSNGNQNKFAAIFDVLDPNAEANQPPDLVVVVKDASGNVIATIATDPAKQNGATVFEQGKTYTFDFSRTTDEKPGVTYLMNWGDGRGYVTVSPVVTHSFADVATFSAAVKATDSSGLAIIKLYSAVVTCPIGTFPPLVVDTSLINITNDPGFHSYQYYNINNAISGGSGQYTAMVDANGDGAYDMDFANPILSPVLNNTSPFRLYSIFTGFRSLLGAVDARLGVIFRDSVCNNQINAKFSHLFTNPASGVPDGVWGSSQKDQLPGYIFLKAGIAGFAGNNEASANADYIATYKMTAPTSEPQRVICGFKWKKDSFDLTFSISGLNRYTRGGRASTSHGMEVNVKNIKAQDLAIGGVIDTLGAVLYLANYYTDGQGDGVVATLYQDANCQINLQMTASNGQTPCNNGLGMNSYAIDVEGTFHCPDMIDSSNHHVQATNGSLYCQSAIGNACIGGGGGGSGGNPCQPDTICP